MEINQNKIVGDKRLGVTKNFSFAYSINGDDKGYDIIFYYPEQVNGSLKNYIMMSLMKEMNCIYQ